jgi:hypothetical protein
MIENLPFGGSLLGTTLFDRICKNKEPALRSPEVFKNELFGRPCIAIGSESDAVHAQHVLRVKVSAAAPGPHRCETVFLFANYSHLSQKSLSVMSLPKSQQSKADPSTGHSINLKSKK